MAEGAAPPRRPAAGPSLKARALRLLAQREHSRSELRRKLWPHALRDATAPGADAADDSPPDAEQAAAVVDALLDWLEAHRHLDERRFVESRVHARVGRFGSLRIRRELAQHGLELDAATAESLRDSELRRAREVWQRRFAAPAPDAAGRAKQMRFLLGRGFSTDVARRVVGAGSEEDFGDG